MHRERIDRGLRRAAWIAGACVPIAAACAQDSDRAPRPPGAGQSSTGFHEETAFPATPPPTCDATVSCSSIAYKHEPRSCADLGPDLASVVVPLRFGERIVAQLPPGESIVWSSTMRLLVRDDGSETVFYTWSLASTTPIRGAILRGGTVAPRDAIVYAFDPSATVASGLQGAWIAWTCGEGRFTDNCLYPFDPVEAEVCYTPPTEPDGGQTW